MLRGLRTASSFQGESDDGSNPEGGPHEHGRNCEDIPGDQTEVSRTRDVGKRPRVREDEAQRNEEDPGKHESPKDQPMRRKQVGSDFARIHEWYQDFHLDVQERIKWEPVVGRPACSS